MGMMQSQNGILRNNNDNDMNKETLIYKVNIICAFISKHIYNMHNKILY